MRAVLRTFLITVVLSAAAGTWYWRVSRDETTRVMEQLRTLNEDMQRRLADREAMLQRLTRTRRLAHIQVTSQNHDASGAIVDTSIVFIELDEAGSELARQAFTVPGDVLFVDAWTVKFPPSNVAEGHPLLGRTLVLLRRVYSDELPPRKGFPIDTPGAVPPGYATTASGRFEQQVWKEFWQIATDRALADAMGVRVAQGEAVYKPVRAGQWFELVVDAVGGMSLTPLSSEEGTGRLSRADE
jgi:hypothetical protein